MLRPATQGGEANPQQFRLGEGEGGGGAREEAEAAIDARLGGLVGGVALVEEAGVDVGAVGALGAVGDFTEAAPARARSPRASEALVKIEHSRRTH